jgi:phosphatidate phosphatase APP1
VSNFDPISRAARSRRREAAASRQRDPNVRHAGMALASDLDATCEDSRLTGAQKDRRFRALMNR